MGTNKEAINPKAVASTRDSKAPLDLLEGLANELTARALQTGAEKYGRKNYRTIPIFLSTYVAAIKRHVDALSDGENYDPESGLPHLAHVGANVHVVLGAQDAGTLVVDLGPGTRTDEQEARSTASNSGART